MEIWNRDILDEHEKLVHAIQQVDVVISTLAVPQHLEQFKIIEAIKEAGNIKVTISFICFKTPLHASFPPLSNHDSPP